MARALRRAYEIDLITLDHPSGDVAGIVGHELPRGGIRLDRPQQLGLHPDRRAHQIIVEEVIDRPGRGLPAHMLDLSGAGVAAVVGVFLGGVIVVARFRRPVGVHLCVKGPVRQVDAFDRVGEGALLQRVGREPHLAVPGAHLRGREFPGAAHLERRELSQARHPLHSQLREADEVRSCFSIAP